MEGDRHMKRESIYTAAQWRWVAERYLEGYTMRELARFLGVHHNTVAEHFQKMEVERMLVPLEERKREFMELGKEGD